MATATVESGLPPGVYEGEDGDTWHKQRRYRQTIYNDDGSQRRVYDLVPRRIIVPTTRTPELVEKARDEAAQRRIDFWHPKHGLLWEGRKRAVDHPENLGTGSVWTDQEEEFVPAPPKPPADPTIPRKEK